MRKVRVEKSINKSLAHDVIKYGPDAKQILFKRGHLVKQEDVEDLKNSGYYSVYIKENDEKGIHENEATIRIGQKIAGENVDVDEPRKGRVRLLAKRAGLLKVKTETVKRVNLKSDFVLATLPNNSGVRCRQEIASVKLVPLIAEKEKIENVEKVLKETPPPFRVKAPRIEKIGAIITGSEIYEGRVEDAFEPVLKSKLQDYNLTLDKAIILPDSKDKIRKKILEFEDKGFELIFVTGGMAVDSDDVTPNALRNTGAKIISRGVPIFPGNMLTIAELRKSKILGIPACALPDQKTSLDIVLPRILAKEKLTKKDIAGMGEGGIL